MHFDPNIFNVFFDSTLGEVNAEIVEKMESTIENVRTESDIENLAKTILGSIQKEDAPTRLDRLASIIAYQPIAERGESPSKAYKVIAKMVGLLFLTGKKETSEEISKCRQLLGPLVRQAWRHTKEFNQLDKTKITAIQAKWRGYLERRPFLPLELRNRTRKLIGDNQFKTKSEMAEGGASKVYLPYEVKEIVIKEITKAGPDGPRQRFEKILLCRKIFKKFNIKHLILPQVWQMGRSYRDYHIEKRLEINIKPDYNLGIYYRHLSLFDNVVRDFVRLFSKVHIQDLVVGSSVNYSNLPFLIERNEKTGALEGKAGLIDIEYFQEYSHGDYGFAELALIFPEHVNVIMEELDKLEIVCNRDILEKCANITKDIFKTSYLDHAKFLEEKGVKQIICPDFLTLNNTEMKKMIKLVTEALRKNNLEVADVEIMVESFIANTQKYLSNKPSVGAAPDTADLSEVKSKSENKADIQVIGLIPSSRVAETGPVLGESPKINDDLDELKPIADIPEWELIAGRTIKVEKRIFKEHLLKNVENLRSLSKSRYYEDSIKADKIFEVLQGVIWDFFQKNGHVFSFSDDYYIIVRY